jgi:RNA methyltransferase, TrmH family
MSPDVQWITSRDNAWLKSLRQLIQDPKAYRSQGQVWLEGEHLCEAYRIKGGRPRQWVFNETVWRSGLWADRVAHQSRVVVLPDRLFEGLSALPSAVGLGCLIDLPPPGVAALPAALADPSDALVQAVVLDRVQDPGNVGSILRTAAAFGCRTILALSGTAALWSTKVVRAGMGAHFSLRLEEGLTVSQVAERGLLLLATSSYATASLGQFSLPTQHAWVFGHEGQGVSDSLLSACATTVRIPQPGGEESFNVAAAAAICLYESHRQGASV